MGTHGSVTLLYSPYGLIRIEAVRLLDTTSLVCSGRVSDSGLPFGEHSLARGKTLVRIPESSCRGDHQAMALCLPTPSRSKCGVLPTEVLGSTVSPRQFQSVRHGCWRTNLQMNMMGTMYRSDPDVSRPYSAVRIDEAPEKIGDRLARGVVGDAKSRSSLSALSLDLLLITFMTNFVVSLLSVSRCSAFLPSRTCERLVLWNPCLPLLSRLRSWGGSPLEGPLGSYPQASFWLTT